MQFLQHAAITVWHICGLTLYINNSYEQGNCLCTTLTSSYESCFITSFWTSINWNQ